MKRGFLLASAIALAACGSVSSVPVDGAVVDQAAPRLDAAAPPRTSAVWIGSGGSSKSATSSHVLQLGVGAVDTVGTVSAPSGATFTPGAFVTQTY